MSGLLGTRQSVWNCWRRLLLDRVNQEPFEMKSECDTAADSVRIGLTHFKFDVRATARIKYRIKLNENVLVV